MKTISRAKCTQCDSAYINGVFCHETGCINTTYTRDCKWCGQSFTADNKYQNVCNDECAEAYNA